MQQLLNTLYITNENAYLSLENENIVITENNEKLGNFPLISLDQVVSFSYFGATPALIGKCLEKGILISFYSPNGKFLYRVESNLKGNVLLRKEQYRISDNHEKSALIARNFIIGKVYNCRWCVGRTIRDHKLRIDEEKCNKTVQYLISQLEKIKIENNLDSIRGLEGESANIYFSSFNDMIINQKNDFIFKGRNRRPPLDFVNALLSFGYTLLASDCTNALCSVGLDPYVGFLHRDRPGRESLALDLMEELRPILVDRFILTLINTNKIHKEDFIILESGAVIFTDKGKKLFLLEWQKHKKEEITHPYLKTKIKWGLVPFIQAQLLARYIRGDIDGYPPFMWK